MNQEKEENMSMEAIAFIGLGHMGAPMARNLLAGGFAVTAFNRSRGPAEALARDGAHLAESPAAAVATGGIAVTMLSNDAALEAVTLGPGGFLEKLGQGGLHISMSTVSPETSRRLASAHAERGSLFLAAPVFGRPEAAQARKLWICQSGPAQAKVRAKPLGEKNGIDRKAMAAFFGQTIFSCPVYQNYGRIVAERAFEPAGFKLELGMKDVRLVRDTAEQAAVPMPIADLLHARILSGLAKGRNDLDWTAIALSAAEDAGLDR